MTAVADAAPETSGAAGNAAVWDAWPVDAARFGEATTTARRAAGDAAGSTEVGRQWSARVDEAVQGLDAVDQTRMDAWIQTHAESPVPEVYEARLVAAWETHTNAGPEWVCADDAHDRADESDGGEAFAASEHDPDVSGFTL